MRRMLVTFLLASVPALAIAAESKRPLEREAMRVHEMLLRGDFQELEALERRTRDLTVVTLDGQPLRAAFFDGVGCMCSGMSDPELREHVRKVRTHIRAWQKTFPESLAPRIADAKLHLDHAWALRGLGWSRQVADHVWRFFRREADAAATKLDAMPESARDEPAWYAARLTAARDQSMPPEKFAPLLEQGLKRHPRYLPIYFIGAAYISPRWNGSVHDLKSFVERAVRATQSWMGDTMYARINWSEANPEMFRNGQASWPRMKKAFERLIADYPDPWNLNNFGNFACKAGDVPATALVMKRIEGSVILAAWDQDMVWFAQCKSWAQRMSTGRPYG